MGLAFRRICGLTKALVFRQQARKLGRPESVTAFKNATHGFAMCGDYFCWIDDTCMAQMASFYALN